MRSIIDRKRKMRYSYIGEISQFIHWSLKFAESWKSNARNFQFLFGILSLIKPVMAVKQQFFFCKYYYILHTCFMMPHNFTSDIFLQKVCIFWGTVNCNEICSSFFYDPFGIIYRKQNDEFVRNTRKY